MAMKRLLLLATVLGGVLLLASPLLAQTTGELDGPMTEDPRYNQKKPATQTPSSNSAAPRSSNESSSEQTRIDLTPPLDEATLRGNKAHASDDIGELHPYNPLRAMKDVEVGNYYFNRGNYKAAIQRYRDALEFKPRDAVATFRLAVALEKVKEYPEAMALYQEYLSILKDGPSANDARKALERLQSEAAAKTASAPPAAQNASQSATANGTASQHAGPAGNDKAMEVKPR
jgi:tetratricopeptide (TPR) repeat protein